MATQEFIEKSTQAWQDRLSSVFNGAIPEYTYWNTVHSIGAVLKQMSGANIVNQIYYPDKGENDLEGLVIDHDSLILQAGAGCRVYPKTLTFRKIDSQTGEWSYFYLEAEVGNFVLVCKGSPYNTSQGRAVIGDTWDARHNDMGEKKFHKYILSVC